MLKHVVFACKRDRELLGFMGMPAGVSVLGEKCPLPAEVSGHVLWLGACVLLPIPVLASAFEVKQLVPTVLVDKTSGDESSAYQVNTYVVFPCGRAESHLNTEAQTERASQRKG